MDSVSCIPGGPRDQATSVFIDGDLYVFGGIGKNSKGLTQVFNDVHKYNPKTNSWVKLMSHAPMGMAGHVTFVHNGKAYVTGGVNQNIFNGYFEDLNEAGKDSTAIDKINAHYFDKKQKIISSISFCCLLIPQPSNGVTLANLPGTERLVRRL